MPLRTLASILVAVTVAACGAGPASERPRNVLLISIDTLRADRLGCYGHTRDTSPALDRLAARGVVFEDCTAASPWTLPSHASLLSGLFPSSHGVKDVRHRLQAPTLATELAARGFATMAVVNSALVGDPRFGLMRSFEPSRARLVPELEAGPDGGMRSASAAPKIVEIASRWLEKRDERPFFLFVHLYDVHSDYAPDEANRARFASAYDGALDGTTEQLIELRARGESLSERDRTRLLELYDAEIRQLDDSLARLFARLDELGLRDSTLIVVTSDHGEEFGEHGGVLHGRTHYAEVSRVPLIVAGPGVPEAHRVALPVHAVDVAPTVLAALGVATSLRFDGLDLAATWTSSASLPDRELYSEAGHDSLVTGPDATEKRSMVRVGPAKLLWDLGSDRLELYDLSRDPAELHDLSVERADAAHALRERLRRFRARADDVRNRGKKGDASELEPLDAETQDLLRTLGYAGDR